MMQAVTPPGAGRDGFEQFYRDAWPGAVRLAGLLTQHGAVAEDIAQEAFTRMFPKFETAANPPSYLRATIVNIARNSNRRAATERSKLPLLFDDDVSEFAFDELADAVAALSFRGRAVIVFRYHFHLSEAEIADALGCRPGTVKSLASRALAQLKKAVEQ
jgi:RNA polymerase sigma factor (sigma-70 family)